ncbi:hypothetical protein [Brevundimonas sp.]|uniref:GH12 family glycosyl hydrolase domain-containing protein n=1 Tax=Brevundimonas sp. TaxID=1871086 RepID=UPI0017CACC05|nr:hypothetical protein [Brevundimonas sp.]MBA4807425.1 hypothetical protein [Brevundimonas sp.]
MYINAKAKTLTVSGAPQKWIGGKAGSETLNGTSLNDWMYDSGKDTLKGGLGDDTYHLWTVGSTVVENASSGIDTVVSYLLGATTLSSNVENLTLAGYGSTSGIGNSLDNIITAGSRSAVLNGKGGNDVLVSGAGADLFQIQAGNGWDKIYGFKAGFDAIQLTGYGITNFAQVKSIAVQVGSDVQLNLANGEKLVIANVTLSSLSAFDFTLKMDPLVADPGEQLLNGASKVYIHDGWYVLNNVWNPGKMVQGVDYTIASTYTPGAPNADVTFQWSFPFTTETFTNIKAFPEIIFGPAPMSGGQKSTDVSAVFPVKVSDIGDLILDYSVDYTGNTGGFNVAFDIWLTSVEGGGASTLTNEVMIWVHKGDFAPFGELVGRYVTDDFSASVYHSGTYTAFVLDSDLKAGQIDLDAMFDYMIGLGIMSEDEFLASVELGAEVQSGAGSLTIDHLDIDLTHVNDMAVVPQLAYASVSVGEELIADGGWNAWGADSLVA